ncbi:MAG: methylated-DNA--[protein]-cysteine S-methyltransferase [Gammaproteobacteria bacterium]|nr:methylated-DNA--[protein]-cysteine S-methyltransferase [Gammaproteobacteria bacterium]TVQ44338.1 MAG: methylated-DNA--[protein]-cysteine S-methyltransferase [Gammaproteobacteria bacterium]
MTDALEYFSPPARDRLGLLSINAQDGCITAIAFVAREELPACPDAATALACRQLAEYFNGSRTGFELPLSPQGTDFQRSVWSVLATIPHGETRSYGEVARRLGRSGAQRAVGAANGRNPIAIVIPCHRVIASDGSPGGYSAGVWRKQWLLAHEAQVSEVRA